MNQMTMSNVKGVNTHSLCGSLSSALHYAAVFSIRSEKMS